MYLSASEVAVSILGGAIQVFDLYLYLTFSHQHLSSYLACRQILVSNQQNHFLHQINVRGHRLSFSFNNTHHLHTNKDDIISVSQFTSNLPRKLTISFFSFTMLI